MSEHTSLAAALAAVQAQLPEIRKGETAVVPTKSGGKYTYSYANLADVSKVVLPLLGRHGLAWITRPTVREDGRLVLAYELRHVSGESISGEYPLPDRGTPQDIGSAITYARRYTLCSVTGVAPADDDDDAAAATRSHREQWDDTRPAPQHDRQQLLATARRAISEATERDRLDAIGRRITEYEHGGQITAQDAVELRRLLVARVDELFPAGGQAAAAAADQDWPEPATPGGGA